MNLPLEPHIWDLIDEHARSLGRKKTKNAAVTDMVQKFEKAKDSLNREGALYPIFMTVIQLRRATTVLSAATVSIETPKGVVTTEMAAQVIERDFLSSFKGHELEAWFVDMWAASEEVLAKPNVQNQE